MAGELTDSELLRRYALEGVETAFTTLVMRHLPVVYGAALRQVNDPALAQDVAQKVFVTLARRAVWLAGHPSLAGWLHKTAVHCARQELRTHRRRHAREQAALELGTTMKPEASLLAELAPVLDETLLELRADDREALVLRFFANKSLRDVGAVLGVQEDAAQKRVARALEALTARLRRRGFRVAGTALAALALQQATAHAVPVGLAASVSGAAISNATTGSGTITLFKTAFKIMAFTKAKTAVAIAVVALAATTTTTVVILEKKHAPPPILEALWNPDTADFDTLPPLARVRLSKPRQQEMAAMDSKNSLKIVGRGMTPQFVFAVAYQTVNTRVVLPPALVRERIDVILTLPDHQQEGLRAELKDRLGFTGNVRSVITNVLLLKVKSPEALKLTVAAGGPPEKSSDTSPTTIMANQPMAQLVANLENRFNQPVVDETGLTNRYDFVMPNLWRKTKNGHGVTAEVAKKELQQMLDDTGLELVPGPARVTLLFVEKVK